MIEAFTCRDRFTNTSIFLEKKTFSRSACLLTKTFKCCTKQKWQIYYLKPTEHSSGKQMERNTYPKNLNNCMINHKHQVTLACFDDNCTQTRIFSNTPFKWRGNHFHVNGTNNRFPPVFTHLTCLLFCCHNICKGKRFNMTFLDWDKCIYFILRYVLSDPKPGALVPLICIRNMHWLPI